MKRIALLLVMIAFVTGSAFAETAVTKAAQNMKDFVGKVVSVTVADPAKGVAEGTISVVDNTGKATNFTVNQSTKVVDATLSAITLNQLKIGQSVEIKAKEGSKEAASISAK